MRPPFLRHRAELLCSLLGLLLLEGACSSSKDESQPITASAEQYCERTCDQAHTCDDASDVAQCGSSCQSALAAKPSLRPDFLAYVAGCIETNDCSLTSRSKCKNEAQAQLFASSYGQTFCAAFVAAGAQCDPSGSQYPQAACLVAAKSYADSALETANACLSKACLDLRACLTQALPVVTLPH